MNISLSRFHSFQIAVKSLNFYKFLQTSAPLCSHISDIVTDNAQILNSYE